MISNLVDALFGCAHKRLTFPMTCARGTSPPDASGNDTYVTCLRCGREFSYDWHRMKLVNTRRGYALAPRPESEQTDIAC